MNFKHTISGLPVMATVALVSIMSAQEVQAQQGGPYARLRACDEYIKQGDWAKAYDEISVAVRVFDPRARQLGLGDKFGQFWYAKGLCELNLGEPTKAIESLNSGITKYPGPTNIWKGASYLLIAESSIKMKDYDGAIKSLNTFIDFRAKGQNLSEEDKNTNMGRVHALLAQCYFLAEKPNFEEGIKNVKLIAENRYKGNKVADEPIIQAFLAMVSSSINADRPEIILDFLRDGRSIVAIEPWRIANYAQVLLSYSSNARNKYAEEMDAAKAANWLKLTHELLTLVPDQVTVAQSIKDAEARMDGFKVVDDNSVTYNKAIMQKIKQTHAEVVTQSPSPYPYGALVMMLTLADYGESQAYRQARSGYLFLDSHYKEMAPEVRENHKLQIITTSTQIGDYDFSQTATEEFKKEFEFPQSQKLESLTNVNIQTLFMDQNFEKAYEEAVKILQSNPEEPLLQSALYIEGASAFQLKKYKEANQSLQKFITNYPDADPQMIGGAMYMAGTSLRLIQSYERAIITFDRFTQKFPKKGDSDLLPDVLFGRAQSALGMESNTGNEKALVDFDRLIKEFGDKEIGSFAAIGKGVLLEEKMKKLPEAKEAYKQAIEIARKTNSRAILGEAMFRLIRLEAKDKATANEAVVYYDEYWKEGLYKEEGLKASFRLMLAKDGLDLLKNVDRKADGMKRVEETIVTVGKQYPDSDMPDLEKAIDNYTSEYIADLRGEDKNKKLDLEAIKQHYYNFPGVSGSDANLLTSLRLALVTVYESALGSIPEDNVGERAAVSAQIQIIFGDIQKSLNIKSMTTSALVKLGTYFAEKTDHPEQAIPYFEEAIARNDPKQKTNAEFGLALAYSRSKDDAQKSKALTMMSDLVTGSSSKNDSESRKTLDKAKYYLTQFNLNAGKYEEALKQADNYLKTQMAGAYRPQTYMIFGEAAEKLGQKDTAIKAYGQIQGTYQSQVSISAPALDKFMQLLYERKRPAASLDHKSDKYLAYSTGKAYVEWGRQYYDQMPLSDRNAFRAVEKTTSEYAKDDEILQEEKRYLEREAEKKASIKRR